MHARGSTWLRLLRVVGIFGWLRVRLLDVDALVTHPRMPARHLHTRKGLCTLWGWGLDTSTYSGCAILAFPAENRWGDTTWLPMRRNAAWRERVRARVLT